MDKRVHLSLSWFLVAWFAALGFLGSFLFVASWPVAFIFGIAVTTSLRHRGGVLTIAIGLMLGGLPLWFMVPFVPGIWWSGLLGDAIMGISFLLGASGAYLYAIMRSRGTSTHGNPPPNTGKLRRLFLPKKRNADGQRSWQCAILEIA